MAIERPSMDTNVGFKANEIVCRQPNLMENDAVTYVITKVFKEMEGVICKTIGPYGTEILIQEYGNSADTVSNYTTRDGYTVLGQVRYTDMIPSTCYRMIMRIAEYMQLHEGDSTSSGIPIASCLYQMVVSNFFNSPDNNWKLSPVGINNLLKLISSYIIEHIKNNDKYVYDFSKFSDVKRKMEILNDVATVSVNNNRKLGTMISNLFEDKLDGNGNVFVDTKLNESLEDTVEQTDAFRLPVSIYDYDLMVNDATKTLCIFENPYMVAFDGPLFSSDIPVLKTIIRTAVFDCKRPVVLAAASYGNEVNEFFQQAIKGQLYDVTGKELSEVDFDKQKPVKIPLAAIPLNTKGEINKELYDDFVLMTGCDPFITISGNLKFPETNDENRVSMLTKRFGTCEKFVGEYGSSLYYGCNPDKEALSKRIEELTAKLTKLENGAIKLSDIVINRLKIRIRGLNTKNTVIKVGGATPNEVKSRKLLIEDAVRSVKSAIDDGGVSIGGNIAICHFIQHNKEQIVKDILSVCSEMSHNIVAGKDSYQIEEAIESLLEIIKISFGNAYRHSLYNMYQDSDKTWEKFNQLLECKNPTIYNIMTNTDESMVWRDISEDEKRCFLPNVIVPRMTDIRLLEIVISVVSQFLSVQKMMPSIPPNIKWEDVTSFIRATNQ